MFFYKGIPESVYRSFEEKAKTIELENDTAKSVEMDSLNYSYQDFYVGGFACYIGVHINKDSPKSLAVSEKMTTFAADFPKERSQTRLVR